MLLLVACLLPLISCNLNQCSFNYRDIILLPFAHRKCSEFGLDFANIDSLSTDDADRVKEMMIGCHVERVFNQNSTNCFVHHATQSGLVTEGCATSAMSAVEREGLGLVCQRKQISASKSDLQADDCPASRSGACPCCPGRGQAVVLYSFLPHSQARCACRQLGLHMAVFDHFQAEEAGRRVHDCVGPGASAWIGGLEEHPGGNIELCAAIEPGPYINHKLRVLYQKVWRPCNQTMPVVCRAPYSQDQYNCFRCQFAWAPYCQHCGFGNWTSPDHCYTPNVSASSSSSECGSCDGCSESTGESSCDHEEEHDARHYFIASNQLTFSSATRVCWGIGARLSDPSLARMRPFLANHPGATFWVGSPPDTACSLAIVDDDGRLSIKHLASPSLCLRQRAGVLCEK